MDPEDPLIDRVLEGRMQNSPDASHRTGSKRTAAIQSTLGDEGSLPFLDMRRTQISKQQRAKGLDDPVLNVLSGQDHGLGSKVRLDRVAKPIGQVGCDGHRRYAGDKASVEVIEILA